MTLGTSITRLYWLTAAITLAAALILALAYAPVDQTMGLVQKLIYVHLPAAFATFLSAFTAFFGGLAYFWTRREVWDRFGVLSARVTVASSAVVLLTGMFWAKFFWGFWWTWSPKLTFTLVMILLYAGHVLAASYLHPLSRRAVFCAVYGMIAFVQVPLVYLSVRLLPDVHPTSIPMGPEMRETLVLWFLAIFMIAGGVIFLPLARSLRRTLPAPAGRARLTH